MHILAKKTPRKASKWLSQKSEEYFLWRVREGCSQDSGWELEEISGILVMFCFSSFKMFLCEYFIFYFKLQKTKSTTPKREKFENSLLWSSFFMGKIRNWRPGRLSQLPISPVTLMCSSWVQGSVTESLLWWFRGLKVWRLRGPVIVSSGSQSTLQTDPLLSLPHPTTPPPYDQPSASLAVDSQLRSSSEAHGTDAHTVHASADKYTCPPVLSLDYMSTWLANSM